jgi:hypothetical protein
MMRMTTIADNYNHIRAGIVELLKTARSPAARNVNAVMTATYWEIRAKDRPVRASRIEESPVWRCVYQTIGQGVIGLIWKKFCAAQTRRC